MNPSIEQLEQAMANAMGNPSSGTLRDTLPTLAHAIHELLEPSNEKETRIIPTQETRSNAEG